MEKDLRAALDEVWLNPRQTAEMVGVKPPTLRKWRQRGVNLTKCRAVGGRKFAYNLKDVVEFLDNSRRDYAV